MAASAFDKHRAQLEIHETMMGRSRGRLAGPAGCTSNSLTGSAAVNTGVGTTATAITLPESGDT